MLTRWGVHVAFWLAYFVVRTAAASSNPPDELSEFPFLANRALAVATYCVLTGVLLGVVLGPLAKHSSLTQNLTLVLGALVLTPLAQWGEQIWPQILAPRIEQQSLGTTIQFFFRFGWVLPLWGLTQALLGYHFRTIAQARDIIRAQKLAHDAQLRMLHYQINPHFLFNTLNAISSLVLDRRNDQAEKMLLRLAGFLRYSLDRQPTELAALTAELEAQRKYLEIEQTRFGDKLSVEFDIEPGLENAKLPSLILQPILENAIKYAITPNTEGGRIDVRAYRSGALLCVSVEDDGPGLSTAPATRRRRGVGLANARERLELIYGDRAGLTAKNREPHGCRIDIWLPFEEEKVGRTVASAVG
jgi:LytS/YehU family sensor histidine kinase